MSHMIVNMNDRMIKSFPVDDREYMEKPAMCQEWYYILTKNTLNFKSIRYDSVAD